MSKCWIPMWQKKKSRQGWNRRKIPRIGRKRPIAVFLFDQLCGLNSIFPSLQAMDSVHSPL